MAGGEPSVTATQAYDLMELARIAAGDAQALIWLRRPDRIGANWPRELAEDSPFRRAFAAFLQHYGHRGVYETYLRNPRWREAPDYLLDSVVNLIGGDPAVLRKRQQQAAADAWRRLRKDLPFWLRPVVAKLVKISNIESNHREAARSALIAYLDVLRRGALTLGQRFTGPGGLDRSDDIFNLTAPEVFALAEGQLSAAAAARRAAQRRRQLEVWAREAEPAVLIEHGDAASTSTTVPASVDDGEGDVWRGTAVGSGRARGKVCIARSPADGLAMAAGDVLVAPSTDPAWTPLFLKAGALIMETGGYLSHGAIVAREFGIPAVVNLPGILDQLHDGEPVEVDGSQGLVRRVRS
jgi:pyruvate,water dikinase